MNHPVMPTYHRLPVSFVHGEGSWLWDRGGRRYLDAVSGIAVCGLGHAHPRVREAVCRQASTLLHTSNLYHIELQEHLATDLTRLAGMDNAFFCNSGAEANEAALKIARMYGHDRGISLPTVVVMENSFHGRTLATLTATGNRRVQAGFEPLIQGFVRAPYDDLAALEAIAQNTPNAVAVLVEPIQGEGGVIVPGGGYLRGIREICDRQGWLLMLDEIQTGLGRSGRMFAFQHEGVLPDVMTVAKSLGNGVPIGACLARGDAAHALPAGSHGSTFGGNPLSCSAALAVLQTLVIEDLAEQAAAMGARMLDGLRGQLGGVEHVVEIRGRGLMIGVELGHPCGDLVQQALAEGLLINVAAEKVIRLLPPLVFTDTQVDQTVEIVTRLVRAFRG
jgi:acetylornithine/N-succinyldiaminopimelate aminotransferase